MRLSPPDSIRAVSNGAKPCSMSSAASRFMVTSSRMAVCGKAPVSTARTCRSGHPSPGTPSRSRAWTPGRAGSVRSTSTSTTAPSSGTTGRTGPPVCARGCRRRPAGRGHHRARSFYNTASATGTISARSSVAGLRNNSSPEVVEGPNCLPHRADIRTDTGSGEVRGLGADRRVVVAYVVTPGIDVGQRKIRDRHQVRAHRVRHPSRWSARFRGWEPPWRVAGQR